MMELTPPSRGFVNVPSITLPPVQEVKFKSYYHDLHWALTEYDRVVTEV